MNLHEYRLYFIAVTGILMLLVASPALSRVLVYPRTEFFTEIWLLGSNQKAENYPYNVSSAQNYNVTLSLKNQLGYCAYYIVEVKFRNATQSAPNSFNMTPSSLPSLFNITAFVADEGTWELPIIFSFSFFNESLLHVEFQNMTLNEVPLSLSGYSTSWNSTKNVFFGDLIFETWIYNSTTNNFQYHESYVDLKLNMRV